MTTASVCGTWIVTSVNADLVAFSILVHLTSIQSLYDRYAKPITNNPTITAAIFVTFVIAYPAANIPKIWLSNPYGGLPIGI
jgi:hypothetical protein